MRKKALQEKHSDIRYKCGKTEDFLKKNHGFFILPESDKLARSAILPRKRRSETNHHYSNKKDIKKQEILTKYFFAGKRAESNSKCGIMGQVISNIVGMIGSPP